MTGQDGLRDEIAVLLTEHEWRAVSVWENGNCACGWTPGLPGQTSHRQHQVDVVLAFVQARIDAAREQVAEQIAQAIEARARADLQLAPGWMAAEAAAGIARQHAKGEQ